MNTIGPSDAEAQVGGDDGEKPPPWFPPFPPGGGGGGRVPGPGETPPSLGRIQWRPPTQAQINSWKNLLAKQGRQALEDSLKSKQKTLEEHYRKLAKYTAEGEFTSSIAVTIVTTTNNINIIVDLLSKLPK